MTVFSDARTPSASIHALSGSTPPGAGVTMQPFGIATAPAAVVELPDTFAPLGTAAADVVAGLAARRAATADPDAEVIDLAGRVVARVAREHALCRRRADVDDAVTRAVPPRSVRPSDAQPISVSDAMVDGARLGLPFVEKLSHRASARLARWGHRLAGLAPRTQAGRKAKAAASTATAERGMLLDPWRQRLAMSVSADALRIIEAEANTRAEQDCLVDGELLALGRLWEESCGRDDRATLLWSEAEDRCDPPPTPAALWVQEGDGRTLGLAGSSRRDLATGQLWYGEAISIQSLRNSASFGSVNHRRDEILSAYDEWQVGRREACERSGLAAAEAALAITVEENAALRSAICRLPAHTPAGVELKVKVVLWLHDGVEMLAKEATVSDVEDPHYSASIALSIVADLARAGIGVTAPVVPASDFASAA